MILGGALLGLLVWPSLAWAVSVRVCVSAKLNPMMLWDYSPTFDGRDLLEDRGRLDQPGALAIPRMLTRVSNRSAGDVRIWGWAPLGDDGCTTPFEAPIGDELIIESASWSYFEESNVSVVSLECPTNNGDCTSWTSERQLLVPPNGGDLQVVVGGTRSSYVHFAAAVAESQVPTSSNRQYYTRTGIELQTVSGRFAGGKPTASIGGDAFRRKFTVAHEYGHLKTLIDRVPNFSNADVDYCYGAPGNCTLTWAEASLEWQSAAAIEGFADFFAMLVWNDPEAAPYDGVRAWSAVANAWTCRYSPGPSDPNPQVLPDDCLPPGSLRTTVAPSWNYQNNCEPHNCPFGVATASDWAFALWDMRVLTDVPTTDLLEMLNFAYPWRVNGENPLYWNDFIGAIVGPILSGDDLAAWMISAEQRGIDD